MDSDIEARRLLKESARFFEIYRVVITYEGYRKRRDGSDHHVIVKILDYGAESPDSRYIVKAESEDGKTATCNGGPDIKVALLTTHWQDLD